MGLRLVLALALALSVLVLAGAGGTRGEEVAAVVRRAAKMVQDLDTDGNGLVDHDELASHPRRDELLDAYFPAAGGHEEMRSFMEAADTNGDGSVSHEEVSTALHEGLRLSPEFIELGQSERESFVFNMIKKGVRAVGNFVKKGIKKVKDFLGFGKKVAPTKMALDEKCVFCQYIVERTETNVKTSGALADRLSAPGDLSAPQMTPTPFDEEAASLLEVEAATGMGPNDPRQARRAAMKLQRQAERAKYNEIFRVMDATLDGVCEQGMPSAYYKHCTELYTLQSDIVDGLRYQYRPSDICFKVGMCATESYITMGIHNQKRFRAMLEAQNRKLEGATCKDPTKCNAKLPT